MGCISSQSPYCCFKYTRMCAFSSPFGELGYIAPLPATPRAAHCQLRVCLRGSAPCPIAVGAFSRGGALPRSPVCTPSCHLLSEGRERGSLYSASSRKLPVPGRTWPPHSVSPLLLFSFRKLPSQLDWEQLEGSHLFLISK